jgi:hypothetical protein
VIIARIIRVPLGGIRMPRVPTLATTPVDNLLL